ncbi:hypothetical protein Back2_09130 [Nocardioides baekrokdamisoli]|uniref:YihY/virulence factor BrkB family protein n=1 Tax=Nocardioides baekrokdamisoli TaxID=1804624 RepID=A0A3G9IE52_9ACTN|nr:hypothetical protein Back2_09130 [Nocardioides baekrokdamisoli]
MDRIVRTQEQYSGTNGSQLAGAVTYFGFLSVFPILALAFFVVGWVSKVYPGAQGDLTSALDSVLPGLVGNGPGQIQLSTFQHSAGTVGVLGLLGVLYAGLGWISSLRSALEAVFEIPRGQMPNLLIGKLIDLVTMGVLGIVLIVSVGVTGAVGGLSSRILGWVGLTTAADWLLWLLALVLGVAANMVLFFAMFRLLARPRTSHRYLWQGALLGAIGFEALKNLSVFLLGVAKGQPAFQVFGISLILLVWINYFSRVTLYAAAWAYVPEEG